MNTSLFFHWNFMDRRHNRWCSGSLSYSLQNDAVHYIHGLISAGQAVLYMPRRAKECDGHGSPKGLRLTGEDWKRTAPLAGAASSTTSFIILQTSSEVQENKQTNKQADQKKSKESKNRKFGSRQVTRRGVGGLEGLRVGSQSAEKYF